MFVSNGISVSVWRSKSLWVATAALSLISAFASFVIMNGEIGGFAGHPISGFIVGALYFLAAGAVGSGLAFVMKSNNLNFGVIQALFPFIVLAVGTLLFYMFLPFLGVFMALFVLKGVPKVFLPYIIGLFGTFWSLSDLSYWDLKDLSVGEASTVFFSDGSMTESAELAAEFDDLDFEYGDKFTFKDSLTDE